MPHWEAAASARAVRTRAGPEAHTRESDGGFSRKAGALGWKQAPGGPALSSSRGRAERQEGWLQPGSSTAGPEPLCPQALHAGAVARGVSCLSWSRGLLSQHRTPTHLPAVLVSSPTAHRSSENIKAKAPRSMCPSVCCGANTDLCPKGRPRAGTQCSSEWGGRTHTVQRHRPYLQPPY